MATPKISTITLSKAVTGTASGSSSGGTTVSGSFTGSFTGSYNGSSTGSGVGSGSFSGSFNGAFVSSSFQNPIPFTCEFTGSGTGSGFNGNECSMTGSGTGSTGGTVAENCGTHPVNEVVVTFNESLTGKGYFLTLQYSASVNGTPGTWLPLVTKEAMSGSASAWFQDVGCLYDAASGSQGVALYDFVIEGALFNASSTSSIVFSNFVGRYLAECTCSV